MLLMLTSDERYDAWASDVRQQLRYGTPDRTVTVDEVNVRDLRTDVAGPDWYVVLRSTDGTDVRIDAGVIALVAGRLSDYQPERCKAVGCRNLADRSDLCAEHTGRGWRG